MSQIPWVSQYFVWFSLTFPGCSKFHDFSLTGKYLPIFQVFQFRVWTPYKDLCSRWLFCRSLGIVHNHITRLILPETPSFSPNLSLKLSLLAGHWLNWVCPIRGECEYFCLLGGLVKGCGRPSPPKKTYTLHHCRGLGPGQTLRGGVLNTSEWCLTQIQFQTMV